MHAVRHTSKLPNTGGVAETLARLLQAHPLLLILPAAFILLIPQIYNGGPFLYRDTATYIGYAERAFVHFFGGNAWLAPPHALQSAAAEGAAGTGGERLVVLSGRSIYYGTLSYLAAAAGWLGLAAVVQALVTAWVIQRFLRVFLQTPPLIYLGTIALLTFGSSLGYFVNLTMPDVFAGISILAFAVLILDYRRQSLPERIALVLILAFAALAHSSHIPLLLGLLAAFLLTRAVLRKDLRQYTAPALLIASVVGIGLLGEQAFAYSVKRAEGVEPLRLPHISAHLIDIGPGDAYLRSHCPQAGFAICAAKDKLPLQWMEVLFCKTESCGVFSSATLSERKAMSEEQFRFASAVFREYPAAVAWGLFREIAAQITMIGVRDAGYGQDDLHAFKTRLTAQEYYRALHSSVARSRLLPEYFTAVSYGSACLSALALIAAVFRDWANNAALSAEDAVIADKLRMALAIVVLGLILNSAICGGIAHAYDRFQSRVVWVLPLVFVATALVWLKNIRKDKGVSYDATQ